MNRFMILTLCCLAVFPGGCADAPSTVRVLSYNIHHGEGMDGRIDLERLADVIRDTDADLVALQEVDRGVRRTNGVDQPARLAELTNMEAVFEKNIDYQGGEYGNAVLSRLPVVFHENHDLPQSLPDEQRGLLEVHVRLEGRSAARENGGHLIFFATHFDYHPDDGERMASVAMLRDLVEQREQVPIIVAGDLNALPDSRVIAAATDFMIDVFAGAGQEGVTFPADEPVRRIDYILHNAHPGLRCVVRRVNPEPVASDHRPVLAVESRSSRSSSRSSTVAPSSPSSRRASSASPRLDR